jgi:hypothetical protein
VRRVLRPAGTYVLNLVDRPALADVSVQAAILLDLFTHVLAIAPRKVLRRRAGGNVLLVASSHPLPEAALRERAAASMDREHVVDARGAL